MVAFRCLRLITASFPLSGQVLILGTLYGSYLAQPNNIYFYGDLLKILCLLLHYCTTEDWSCYLLVFGVLLILSLPYMLLGIAQSQRSFGLISKQPRIVPISLAWICRVGKRGIALSALHVSTSPGMFCLHTLYGWFGIGVTANFMMFRSAGPIMTFKLCWPKLKSPGIFFTVPPSTLK
nr:hypothetical protein [Solanum melongena]WMB97094.1 hypothetical protein [Solanum aethiopicum]